MKKTKLTRSLLAACSIVALTAVMYGCVHNGGGDPAPMDETDMEMPDPAIAERAAIAGAITKASTAVAAVNDTASDATVAAADSAITDARTAISNATNVPAKERDANTGTVDVIATNLATAKTSRTEAMNTAAEEMRKAMAAAGKALHGALGTDPLAQITDTVLTATGISVTTTATGDTEPAQMAGESAGALGSWNGKHYIHTDAGTKVLNHAVVYTNQGAPKSAAFAEEHVLIAEGQTNAGSLEVTDANLGLVMADDFTHSGALTHQPAERADAVYVRGTYDGAPGEFRCVTGCSSTNDGMGSPSALVGTWHFTPDMGAMVSQPDDTYLYYGWWLRKDKDDMPTMASAFTGTVLPDGGTAPESASGEDITGSADYVGGAAGKFAINNPLGGSDAGHFTADATLSAKFGDADDAGMTGTIDNFMANEQSVPWSVKLNLAGWAADGEIEAPTDDAATADVNEAMATVWSIDGNSAAASGTWSGQMYDEMPGDPPAGDGSNIPTTVTGTFQSMFGGTHTMVGAFGADKQ